MGCLFPFFLSGAGFVLLSLVAWIGGWHRTYRETPLDSYQVYERAIQRAKAQRAAQDAAAIEALISSTRARDGGAL